MRHTNNFLSKKAVSPTVGVILMVAITVVLAATIGYVLTDMGGENSQNAQAGVQFNENGNEIGVALNSLPEGSAEHIYVISDHGSFAASGGLDHSSDIGYNDGPTNPDQYLYTTNTSTTNSTGGTGTVVTVDLTGVSDSGQITVVGVTSDPSENIIQTYDY